MAKGKYEYWITPEGLIKLGAWARDGLTDEQLAQCIGINPDTLYTWKKKYPEISEALKKGKEVIDIQVENALLKRALGYSYDEITKERTISDDGTLKMVVTKVVTKEVQADTTAQIYWLKNRMPDRWRDKKDVEVSGIVNNPFQSLTADELKKLIKE